MLTLTEYDKKMLNGEMGKFKQKAMEYIVSYANVLGATELCTVSRATCGLGAFHALDSYPEDTDYATMFSEFYMASDETVELGTVAPCCKAQSCAGSCDYTQFKKNHLSEEYFQKNKKFLDIAQTMGMRLGESCTPYYTGWVPMYGEYFVSTESSNIVVSNTVFGARGNADGLEAATCAAITGRTPKFGMHLDENRYATCVFNLDFEVETIMEWDLLGFTLGRLLPKHQVPVIKNGLKNVEINRMRQLCASLATTSAAEICHIVGHTPEAKTLEMALGSRAAKYEITVTQKDMDDSMAMLCDQGSGPVDYVAIGCPHLAVDELQVIASYIKGRTLPEGVELHFWTDYPSKAMATLNGYTQIIEETGAAVLTGSCPIVMKEESHKHAKNMVMFGAKQAIGIRNQSKAKVYYGELEQCIDAAFAGRWEAVL